MALSGFADGRLVEGGILPAVEFVATGKLKTGTANLLAQILGPAAHGWNCGGTRPSQPDHRDLEQVFALHERIGEVRSTNSDSRDVAGFVARRLQNAPRRIDYPAADIARRRPLRRHYDGTLRYQNGVRIGPAHIYSQSHARHPSLPTLRAVRGGWVGGRPTVGRPTWSAGNRSVYDGYCRGVNEPLISSMQLADPIATKFAPPVRPAHQVIRAALLHKLDDAVSSRRLTLIHAPAGYGKTSLLAQLHRALKDRSLEVVWLTLEEEESDPTRFADSLMFAIVGGRLGENAPLRTATSAIVNRCLKSAGELIVILDDFQRAESVDVCNFFRTLIRLVPPTRSLRHLVTRLPSSGLRRADSRPGVSRDRPRRPALQPGRSGDRVAQLGERAPHRRRGVAPRGAHRRMADRRADDGSVTPRGR